MVSLLNIANTGQTSLATVAPGIPGALIATAMGLLAAIPAVLAYNALSRGNKGIISKLNRFAFQLHAYFLTGAAPKSQVRSMQGAA